MLTFPIFELRAPSLRRVPAQSGHVANVATRSTKARMCGWSDSTSFDSIDLWMRTMSPSYVRFTLSTLILVASL